MAIDSQAPPALEPAGAVSAIENELPTYRAISRLAVLSVLLGGLAVFGFVHPAFLLAAVAAILAGLLALRAIRRMPDVLTGAEFARFGIFLGVALGLSALTTGLVRGFLIDREAAKFAREYVETLNGRNLAEVLWYKLTPGERKGVTPEEALARFNGQDPSQRMIFDQQFGPLQKLLARLTEGRKAQYDSVENRTADGLDPIVFARLRVEGPGAATDEFALIEMKADGRARRPEWRVEDLHYPYKPNTHVESIKPVDDGHGHGGGGH